MSEPGVSEPRNQEVHDKVRDILTGQPDGEAEDNKLVDGKPDLDVKPAERPPDQISDQDDPPGDDQAAEPGGDTDQGEADDDPVTLNELADNLGVDAKDLYDVAIKLPNNETATLGEMKDAFKEYQTIKAEREQYDETRQRDENALMVEKRQVEQLLTLGISEGKISQSTLDLLNKQHETNMQREGRAVIEAIPTWRDAEVRRADFEVITEMMSEYGFSSTQILNIGDANIVKFLYDKSKEFSAKRFLKKQGKAPPAQTGRTRRTVKVKPNKLRERITAAKTDGGKVKTRLISDLITGVQEI